MLLLNHLNQLKHLQKLNRTSKMALITVECYEPSTSKFAEHETCPEGLAAVTSIIPTSSPVTLISRSTCVCSSILSVMTQRSVAVNL